MPSSPLHDFCLCPPPLLMFFVLLHWTPPYQSYISPIRQSSPSDTLSSIPLDILQPKDHCLSDIFPFAFMEQWPCPHTLFHLSCPCPSFLPTFLALAPTSPSLFLCARPPALVHCFAFVPFPVKHFSFAPTCPPMVHGNRIAGKKAQKNHCPRVTVTRYRCYSRCCCCRCRCCLLS